jgi:DNA-binding transcriptional ArsR family regulator
MTQRLSITDGGQSTIDRILSGLDDPRRRYVLYYLDEADDAYIEDVARQVAAWERDCDTDDVPAEARKRVEIQLYHVHLPMLEDLDLIDYDQRSGGVCFKNPPDALPEFLELASSVESIN